MSLIFLLVVLQYTCVDAFIDVDFKQITNAVGSIIEIVQKAAENPDCIYSCPRGYKKYPNRHHKPTPNGCGSLGVDVDLSHLPSFVSCCDGHDICYETCGNDREFCDNQFNKCMSTACNKDKKQKHSSTNVFIAIDACKVTAEVIFRGVSTFGCKSYLDSQKRACVCRNDSRNRYDEL